MKKRAFIVIGAESSGTRLMTKILIEGGCQGESTHEQKFDEGHINGDPIVWRRSVPHNHQPVYLRDMMDRLRDYKVMAIITVRNLDAMERSQIAAPHVIHINQATANIRAAYLTIFNQISTLALNYIIVPYESLVLNPVKTQKKLFERLGLPGENTVHILNANEKWL